MEVYRIEISVEHKRKKRVPVVVFNPEKESLTLNGRRCKQEKAAQ
jgi:hypothetical protein